MPTDAEKRAQIEAALRRRFFPLVPRVDRSDRAGWPDSQHDTDRLSRALAAYAICGVSQADDVTAAAAITDGSDDGGIDALYVDQARNRIVLVQSKFKISGAAPAQDEVLKTIAGVKALLNRRFDEFNSYFKDRLDEIEAALDTPGAVLEIVMVYLGDNFGEHATNNLNALRDELNVPNERCIWSARGLTAVYDWLIAEQNPTDVTADIMIENWRVVMQPRKVVYGQINANELASLVTSHGTSLFQRNIRHYLGSVQVNTAIERTARNQPGDLFYLNNGLTAVAETITAAPGTPERCKFRFKSLSIVNGAQTAGSITNAALNGALSADAKLLITVIEIGQNVDDIGLRITKARNHQTVVRSADFAALDPAQENLRQELAVVGVNYHYRPSAEARIRRDDSFALEDAAIAIACLGFRPVSSMTVLDATRRGAPRPANAIDYVVTSKKELGRLWDQDGSIYRQLFPANLSGVRMCRLVRIYRFLDAILDGTENSETGYFRRMFFRHGRYFIMAFVSYRASEIMTRASHVLSPEDRQTLSRITNDVTERIYATSSYLIGSKGFLAVFRNVTDAQPLADRVLAHFDAIDHPTPPSPPPAPAPSASVDVESSPPPTPPEATS